MSECIKPGFCDESSVRSLLPALLTVFTNTSLCRATEIKGLPKHMLVPPRMRRENSFICAFREHLTGASSMLGTVHWAGGKKEVSKEGVLSAPEG